MTYQVQNFRDGQVLTAAQLNHMEEGIRNLADQESTGLSIGTVTGGTVAGASIKNGKLNLVLPKGETGAAGPQGPKGDKGDAGATGAQGPKGDTGATGATGPAGKEGAAGEKGDKGDPGPTGPAGPKGETGTQGPKGDKGDTGITPALSIGTVMIGSNASASISGTAEKPELNLILPRGETGPQGEQGPKGDTGDKGDTGAMPALTIGTVESGESASATITGSVEAPVLNLVLPKGPKGDKGDSGSSGSGGSADLTIGTVTSGTEASATIEDGKLNLVLPKGDKGDTGETGATGAKGEPGEGLTANAKTAILTLFENAAYGSAEMKTTLDALKAEWT